MTILPNPGYLQGISIESLSHFPRTSAISWIYLIFLIVGTIERITNTFDHTKSRANFADSGVNHMLFLASVYGYMGIVLTSVLEFFISAQELNLAVSAAGLLVYLSGVVLRRRAIADLGDNWSLNTGIRPGHILVKSGIYRYLKHPYYGAVICELIGVCLVANAAYAFGLVLLAQGPCLITRIKLEENLLRAHFAGEYQDYIKGKIL